MKTLKYFGFVFLMLSLGAFFDELIRYGKKQPDGGDWFMIIVGSIGYGIVVPAALLGLYHLGMWEGKKEMLIRSIRRRFPDNNIRIPIEAWERIKAELREEGVTLKDLGLKEIAPEDPKRKLSDN